MIYWNLRHNVRKQLERDISIAKLQLSQQMDGLLEMVIPLSPLHCIMLPKTLNSKSCLWIAKTLLGDIQEFCLLKDWTT